MFIMQKNKDKQGVIKKENTTKTRHYFFLNTYDDCAFTKCPKCDSKTKLRKFPLVIHIEPQQMLFLNKNCKYCLKCDLIIVKKSEIEMHITAQYEKVNPSIIGNKYLVFGTLDRSDWRKYHNTPPPSNEVIEQVYIFKDVLNFEVVGGGWYKDS